jgi:hypothetical protein
MKTRSASRRHPRPLRPCWKLLLLSVLLLGPGRSLAADWRDLPDFDLDECARVRQSVVPDPAAPVPGNYTLVTTFAADDGPAAAGTLRVPGLVTSVIDTFDVDPQNGVTRTRSLVVRAATDDLSSSLHWIVVDGNGDGQVDRARVYELGRDESGRLALTPAAAPDDRFESIQAYFDDASTRLFASAGREIPAQCR